MKILTLTLSLMCLLLPLHANSTVCSFLPGHDQTILNIDIPATLSIPRDTPNGTVIYESPPITLSSTSSSFECTERASIGIRNFVGTTNPESTLFPVSNTAIAWQWKINDKFKEPYPSGSRSAGAWGVNGTVHSLVLVKIADITAAQKIPSGSLGDYYNEGVSPLVMATQGMTILPQSCETPDVSVDMGIHDLSLFSEFGKHSNPVQFNIKVNNCPQGINKITYNLTPTPSSPVISNDTGIIELNKSSTAKGIALQLLDENYVPMALNTAYTFNGYSSAGGNFSIPLSAQFIRTLPTGKKGGFDPGMSAGTANAEVWFIMSYL